MPALYWCGRRWRTGSDDFTISSTLFFLLMLITAIVLLSRFRANLLLPQCPTSSKAYLNLLFALGILDGTSALSFIILAWLSLRGTPFQTSKRQLVPLMLYVTVFFLLAIIVLSIILAKFSFRDGELRRCESPTHHILIFVIAMNFLVPGLFFFLLALTYDPDGARRFNDSDDYESLWWKRCRLLCCHCFQSSREDDAYMDVAKTFASIFRAYDMVPSDVVAGMLLVHGNQQRAMRAGMAGLQFPHAPNGCYERLSTQARPFPKLTTQQVMQLNEIASYSRFYMAAYGWMLYQYVHCCFGMPRLCCFDPTMCCRQHPGMHDGTRFFCDLTTLLKVTGVADEDVILSNWSNSLFRPVFYVALDRTTDALVVAIRGTMSFADCVTDFVASPEPLPIPSDELGAQSAVEDFFVHGGMKRCAEYVLQELDKTGVLDRILCGDLSGHRLVVLGHSLGAGVATILSIILWTTRRSLRKRLRCLAYAPPGGLLSASLVAYSKSFILGCFAGHDMIPRTALHTFESLRESIFDALATSHVSKSLLFLNIFRTENVAMHSSSLLNTPVTRRSLETCEYRDGLRRPPFAASTETRKLYPPATLLHFCKAVIQAPSSCCTSRRCCKSLYEEMFVPSFETPADVQVVICAPSMFTDHFPDRLFDIIQKTKERLENEELDRFFIGSHGEADIVSNPSYGSVEVDAGADIV